MRGMKSVIASETEAPGRVAGLDLLRGLAALAVVVFHLTWAAHRADPSVPPFKAGHLGVEVFFVISGYVILMSAYRSHDRRAFALARLIRLYPTYLICMGLTTAWVFGLGVWRFEVSPSAWLLNLTMVPGWFHVRCLDGVYWTLGYEVGFYVVVAALLPAAKRGYALHLSAAFLLVLPLLSLGLRNASFFTMGIALYEFRRNRLFAVVVLSAAIVIGHHLDMTLVAPLLVAVAASVPAPRRFGAWAGAVSYPLYLLHDDIGWVLVLLYGGALGGWGGLALGVSTIVLLAASVQHFGERPISAFLKSAVKRPAGVALGRFAAGDAARPGAASAPMRVNPGIGKVAG